MNAGSRGLPQVRLTNVAIIRLKRGGARFEVAAYKNKVENWRSRVETDIAEVLQVPSVFTNVSRGVHAKSADLIAAFGTDDHLKCAIVILEKGELEKGELERQAQFGTLFRDIATTVAEKCVDPTTQRPYPVAFIEQALHDVHFAVAPTKSAKSQALKAVAALRARIPIERAKMQLRVTLGDPAQMGAVRTWLGALAPGMALSEGAGGSGEVAALDLVADPGMFRVLDEGLKGGEFKGCFVEVVSLSVGAGGAGGGADSGSEGEGGDAGRGGGGGGGGVWGGGGGGEAAAAAAAVARAAAPTAVRRVVLPGSRLACNACGVAFSDAAEHKEHHRSPWHRVNLKRKVGGQEPMAEADFSALPEKQREALLAADV